MARGSAEAVFGKTCIKKRALSLHIFFDHMKEYPLRIKILAWLAICIECLILIAGFGYVMMTRYAKRLANASVLRINKANVVASPSAGLLHFYEWGANQTITHERPWLPHSVTATTNNDGLISDGTDYSIEKPMGVYRIITIGDSFTEGPFVEPSATYPKQLESMLNAANGCPEIAKYEVLNFGVGGYDIEYSSHRLVIRGAKYQPDLVLWFLKNDDFIQRTDIDREKEHEYNAYIRDELDGDISKFNLFQKYASEFSNVTGEALDQIHGIVVREQMDAESHIKYFSAQEEAVRQVVDTLDAQLVMETFVDTDTKFKARMKLWTKENNNVFFYDDIPKLVPGRETFDPNDGHPNKSGYTIIAETVQKNLVEHGHLCRANK